MSSSLTLPRYDLPLEQTRCYPRAGDRSLRHNTQEEMICGTHPFSSSSHDSDSEYEHEHTCPRVYFRSLLFRALLLTMKFRGRTRVYLESVPLTRRVMKKYARANVSATRPSRYLQYSLGIDRTYTIKRSTARPLLILKILSRVSSLIRDVGNCCPPVVETDTAPRSRAAKNDVGNRSVNTLESGLG